MVVHGTGGTGGTESSVVYLGKHQNYYLNSHQGFGQVKIFD